VLLLTVTFGLLLVCDSSVLVGDYSSKKSYLSKNEKVTKKKVTHVNEVKTKGVRYRRCWKHPFLPLKMTPNMIKDVNMKK